jgi:hypothetical protein
MIKISNESSAQVVLNPGAKNQSLGQENLHWGSYQNKAQLLRNVD